VRVQWTGENLDEIRTALGAYGYVEIELPAKALRITAHELKGMGFMVEADIEPVQLGETIEIRAGANGMTDGIGIHRLPDPGPDNSLAWNGRNYFEIRRLINGTGAEFTLDGDDLLLRTPELVERREFVRVRRGDKLFVRQTSTSKLLGVSRAGQDHRA
jgi:hypothetical protein